MTTRRSHIIGVALLLSAAGAGLYAAQDVTLRHRWTQGETQRYRLTQETAVVISGIPGMGEMTVNTTMAQIYRQTASEVAPLGAATLAMTYESFKMNVASMAGGFTYDSDAPAPSTDPMGAQMSQIFGAMVGKTITMVMAPTGAVEKVEGMSKLMESMKVPQGLPGGVPGLEGLMSDDSIKAMFSQSASVFPARAIKPGDSWPQEITIPNPMGTMMLTATHTFKGMEPLDGRDVARVSSVVTMKPAPGGGGALAGLPMSVQMGEGSGDNEVYFDNRRGVVVKTLGHMNMPMTMSMTGPDGSSITMQSATRVTTTMELIQK